MNIKSKLKLRALTRRRTLLVIGFISLLVYIEIHFKNYKYINKAYSFLKSNEVFYRNKACNSTKDFLWERKSKTDIKNLLNPDSDFNRTSCYLLDFLSGIDPSFRTFDMGTVCDDLVNQTDILCRIYLRQIGVDTEHEREACAYKFKDLVPKFVYFVTFGEYTFQVWNYIAVVAARRHVQPTALYVIGDQHPKGPWWQLVIRDVPGLRFIYRQAPMMVSGKKVTIKQHMSDIVRLQILYLNGGIYLDTDQVVLRNLDTLLVHNLTLGFLNPGTGMGNAFISSKRHCDFVKEWYQSYTDFHNTEWGFNSMKASNEIYKRNTSRVNLITDLVYRPQYWELPLLMNESFPFDWRKNYAIHIWTAHGKLPKTLQEIQTGNSTVLQVFRYILYGDPRPRTEKLEIPDVLQ